MYHISYHKPLIRGVFRRSYCYFGNLLCHENDMITTCSPMAGQFFDSMIAASSDKECYNDPSKSKRWKLL